MKQIVRVLFSSVVGGGCRAAVVALIAAVPASAINIQPDVELPYKLAEAIEKIDPLRYRVTPQPLRYEYGRASEAGLAGWSAFQESFPGEWRVQVDARTQAPLLVEGASIPLVPGPANDLTTAAFGEIRKGRDETLGQADISAAAQGFLEGRQTMLGLRTQDLALDTKKSVGIGRNNRFWSVRYNQIVHDSTLGKIPVRGAYAFVRINRGNVVQFGNQLVTEVKGIDTSGIVSREQAVKRARDLLGDPTAATGADPVIDLGQADRSLQIVPVNAADGSIQHELVRSIVIDSPELNFELWFDAHSGELVNAINRRRYVDGTVTGGIYPLTNTDTEVVRSMPFLTVVNDAVSKTTDAAGVYDYAPSGSLSTATLDGDFLSINDNCGASSLSTSVDPGDLNFHTGGGTDCSTPVFGGPGNTHSARSTYYHTNLIIDKARRYLNEPVVTTPWLEADLTANVNISSMCNAYWNGVSINFFRFGNDTLYDCSNTGEIAAVFLHEWGHGLQANTAGIPDSGTGEAFADVQSVLETHESCIGHNFTPGVPCQFGCDASCTGVRDIDLAPDVSPANIEGAPADCDGTFLTSDGTAIPLTCPWFGYMGPMGYEGHCEGLIASGAVWDMIQSFVGRYGSGAGWALADRIWYDSVYLTGDAYQVVAGGTCNPAATIDGCGADNWYTVFLALDDDNANLADGTPNAAIIWSAFNKHGIACGAGPPAEFSTCPALATPTLTVTPNSDQFQLDWDVVPGAASYRVFRNEFQCDWGFTPIAEVTAPDTSYTDTTINDFTTYYYAVQALGGNDLCFSAFSTCTDAVAAAPPSATPATGLEIGPYLGYFFFDSGLPISDGPLIAARLDLDVGGPWSIETEIGATLTDDSLNNDGVVLQVSENFLFHLTPRPAPVEWFLTAGVGALFFTGFSADDSSLAGNIGAGVKIDVAPNRDLRIDVRDYIADDAYGAGTTHNVQLTLGLVFKVP